MMRYILLLLIISFGCSPVFAENRAMKDMCNRLFPEHSGNFTFELAPDSLENDFFTIESINDKIKISGNNNNSLATGLNHYLKYLMPLLFQRLLPHQVLTEYPCHH